MFQITSTMFNGVYDSKVLPDQSVINYNSLPNWPFYPTMRCSVVKPNKREGNLLKCGSTAVLMPFITWFDGFLQITALRRKLLYVITYCSQAAGRPGLPKLFSVLVNLTTVSLWAASVQWLSLIKFKKLLSDRGICRHQDWLFPTNEIKSWHGCAFLMAWLHTIILYK